MTPEGDKGPGDTMSQSSETLGSGTPERYRARVASEIRHFSGLKEFHLLPGAHHYWANKYLRPEVERVFGCTGPVEIYARECVRAFGSGAPRRIASLGCVHGSLNRSVLPRHVERGPLGHRGGAENECQYLDSRKHGFTSVEIG